MALHEHLTTSSTPGRHSGHGWVAIQTIFCTTLIIIGSAHVKSVYATTNKLANIKNLAIIKVQILLPEKHQSNLSSQFQVDTVREAPK